MAHHVEGARPEQSVGRVAVPRLGLLQVFPQAGHFVPQLGEAGAHVGCSAWDRAAVDVPESRRVAAVARRRAIGPAAASPSVGGELAGVNHVAHGTGVHGLKYDDSFNGCGDKFVPIIFFIEEWS